LKVTRSNKTILEENSFKREDQDIFRKEREDQL